MLRILFIAYLIPLSIQQLTSSCTTCNGPTNAGFSTTNQLQRDDSSSSSSSNMPGYLPDYQGDQYTNPQRIAETQALNKAFFDSIGGAPPPPPLTPAQQGMNNTSSSSSSGNFQQPQQQQYGGSVPQYNPPPQQQQQYGLPPQQQPQQQQYGVPQQQPQQYASNGQPQQQIGYNPQYNAPQPQQQQQQQYGTPQYSYISTNYQPQSNNQYSRTLGSASSFYQYPSVYQNVNSNLNQQQRQNAFAYDATNQNSPYYYQKTPSTQEYNSILGINAGFPQVVRQNALMYDSSSLNSNPNSIYSSTSSRLFGSSASTTPTQFYDNNSGRNYDSTTSQSTRTQYNPEAISCCSQVSSTCCYQIQNYGNSASSNTIQYNPSVYQYGRK